MLALKKVTSIGENAHITVLTSKKRPATRVLCGAWKDLDCALKNGLRSLGMVGHEFTEAYKQLVLMNIKGKAEVVRDKAGEVAKGNHGTPDQPCG